MKIEYLQDMEEIKEQKLVENLKKIKYSSYHFENGWWGEEPLLEKVSAEGKKRDIYRCNFVGIVWYQNRLLLSLPKSVKFDSEEDQEKRKDRLIEYAELIELFANEIRNKKSNFTPFMPWCVENLTQWCKNTMNTNVSSPSPQIIATVKFEKVFEWMLGLLFSNQLKMQDHHVLFESRYLKTQNVVDINDQEYNFYRWVSVKKRNEMDRKLQERENVFENQEKRNIPDIVTEIEVAGTKLKKCCCVFDAKYSGWDAEKQRYKLPDNMDIYKQFFYQEQMLRLYEENQIEDMEVFNFLILPDYLGDTGEHMLRLCAVIEFSYHETRKIPVLQINMEKLIRFCLYRQQPGKKEDVMKLEQEKDNYMKLILLTNKKVVSMPSGL